MNDNIEQNDNTSLIKATLPNEKNIIAIVGLVFSILGVGIVGLILSILGLKKSKKINDGKTISVIGIVVSVMKLIFASIITVIVILGIKSVKHEVVDSDQLCQVAYDCSNKGMFTDDDVFHCYTKDEYHQIHDVVCNRSQLLERQIVGDKKTTPTTTTKLAEDYETVLKRELDFNKLIKDDRLNIKINEKNNNIRKEKIDKLPDKIDKESEYTYVINNNKHTIKEYLYNAKEDIAYGDYMYDVLVTIDGYAYKFDETRFENYEDNDYLNIYIDSDYTEYSEVLKDIATGKEYYMLVYYYCGASTHYQFVIIDDDGNILITYEDGGEFYLDSDSWDEDPPYLSKKVIEYKDDKFKFMIDSSYVSYDINHNYKDHKSYGREVYGYIKNGEIIFENGNLVEGHFTGQE